MGYVLDKAGNYGEVRMVNGVKPDRNGNVNIGGSGAQSDWNQNDETAPDYIKNRTHYKEIGKAMLEETVVLEAWAEGLLKADFSVAPDIKAGKEYIVEINGVERTLTAVDMSNEFDSYVSLEEAGQFYMYFGTDRESGESFNRIVAFIGTVGDAWSVSIKEPDTVHRIDPKFLPEGYPYKEFKKDAVLMNGINLDFTQYQDVSIYGGKSPFGHFIAGEKYTVILDGGVYSDIVAHGEDADEGCVSGLIEPDDNDFTMRTYEDGTISIRVYFNPGSHHDVIIKGPGNEIYPMSAEYLPNELKPIVVYQEGNYFTKKPGFNIEDPDLELMTIHEFREAFLQGRKIIVDIGSSCYMVTGVFMNSETICINGHDNQVESSVGGSNVPV